MTRFASVRVDGRGRAARLDGGELTLLPYDDVGALLRSGDDWLERSVSEGVGVVASADADFAPLVINSEKIFAVGLNYGDHAAETGRELPEYPQLFSKFPGVLIGANDEILMPRQSDQVDWEAELGVVIGSPARFVQVSEALRCVAGYTVTNDVSVRDWQRRTSQYLQGKIFERTTPVGPWLVTPDEVDADNLTITCEVDQEEVQNISTTDMIFTPAFLISYISQIITLNPGDLILTGTGAGVGVTQTPPRFLRPGQRLMTSIEGIGTLENLCVSSNGPVPS